MRAALCARPWLELLLALLRLGSHRHAVALLRLLRRTLPLLPPDAPQLAQAMRPAGYHPAAAATSPTGYHPAAAASSSAPPPALEPLDITPPASEPPEPLSPLLLLLLEAVRRESGARGRARAPG